MPIQDYGVWKARPVTYQFEYDADDHISPHLSLFFDDGQDNRSSRPQHEARQPDHYKHRHGGKPPPSIPGLNRAAINIKSGDKKESRLVFWINRNFQENPMVNNLSELDSGFKLLENEEAASGLLRLDLIRGNLFNVDSGRLLPHDIEGPNNDMIDVLEPEVKKAIEEDAEIYLFGEQFNSRDGIHNCHMNQGNSKKYQKDDGVFQDGGLLIHYPSSGQWVGVFMGFASQAVHTDEDSGHAISSETWADYLSSTSDRADLIENSVSIDEVQPEEDSQTRRKSVTLTNRTDHKIPLSTWKVKNSAGHSQTLPSNAELNAKATDAFDISNVDFSTIADTATLLNEKGLKVDGVSYNSHPGKVHGQSVVFAQ
ncbi:Protein of unknown function DUF2278 [Penicillium angulare]|uniref:LTD domain-containing protein n=1 Tax=Penicillium angulare TaxID=116970 RepID=A0A9W9K981_9EURO|nr:Protein of unknown function DUF2278 [Penicillium angulare]